MNPLMNTMKRIHSGLFSFKGMALVTLVLALSVSITSAKPTVSSQEQLDWQIITQFSKHDIMVTTTQVKAIRELVKASLQEQCDSARPNSQIGFSAVEIAQQLELNPKENQDDVEHIKEALKAMALEQDQCRISRVPDFPELNISWEDYYNDTLALNNDSAFLALLQQKGYSPVKISWEDIGRWENSVWGDRISDVGIWVRKKESDSQSSQLALSVRRDNNYTDKVLMVPAQNIKIHLKQNGQTVERTLPQQLKALGLQSNTKDKNVIVSNQFAVVPVPSHSMKGAWKKGTPPRAAFNFSIYPYGSTNFVITDVIEGSSNALIGPGGHQLLFANINGKKAPFTASRAQDRQDLLRLEAQLKQQGMDVDVQRYYLIQIPLKKKATGIALANQGTPPSYRDNFYSEAMPAPMASMVGASSPGAGPMKAMTSMPTEDEQLAEHSRNKEGLTKVAIGHGETEGRYFEGAGWQGKRAEEPIRVTVVYFVTPVGKVTQKDMDTFSQAFQRWDNQAIWGGSFVVKN